MAEEAKVEEKYDKISEESSNDATTFKQDESPEQDQESEENENFLPDSQLSASLAGLQVYVNKQRTSFKHFMSVSKSLEIDENISKNDMISMLLYPTVVSIEQQFFSSRKLLINDIQVSIIEFETSFKQIF